MFQVSLRHEPPAVCDSEIKEVGPVLKKQRECGDSTVGREGSLPQTEACHCLLTTRKKVHLQDFWSTSWSQDLGKESSNGHGGEDGEDGRGKDAHWWGGNSGERVVIVWGGW